MPRTAIVAAVIVAIVIVAAIAFLSVAPDVTSDATLYDTGNVEGAIGGTAPGTQPPPGSQPPPEGPPPEDANKIGTYSIYATVIFADGTSSVVSGQQGFATAPYYSGKQVASFRYEGRFTAAQEVVLPAGNFAHTKLQVSDSGGRFFRAWDPNTPTQVRKNESRVVLNATITAAEIFPSTYPAGQVSLIWSAQLEFIYQRNGTYSPKFLLQSPVLTISVQEQGGGGGGGGGQPPRFLSVIDARVWATLLRGY